MINRSTGLPTNESLIKNQKPLKIKKSTFATLPLCAFALKDFFSITHVKKREHHAQWRN